MKAESLAAWIAKWKEMFPFDPIGEYYAIQCIESGLTHKQIAKKLGI